MKRGLLALTMGLLSASVLPATAIASGPHFQLPAGHVIQFRLRGSGGYRIEVITGGNHRVLVLATRGPAETAYFLHGHQTNPNRIEARLPGVGEISVGFVANDRERQRRRWELCGGQGRTVHYGSVRGKFRFDGENGYTEAEAGRIKAKLITWPSQRCRKVSWPPLWNAFFEAYDLEHGRALEFSAFRYSQRQRPAARRVVLKASEFFSRGKMAILREVSVNAEPSTFLMPNAKTTPEDLVFTPPPPFTGMATLERTPESTFVWSGSLSVSFPGTGPRRLTGPGFETKYCALGNCFEQSP